MSTVALDIRPDLRPPLAETAPARSVRVAPRPLRILSILLQATAILLLLFLNKTDVLGTVAFFTVLGFMFIISPEMAMRALVLGYLGLITNVVFVPKYSLWTVARFGLMTFALARFSFDLVRMRQSLLTRPYYLALLLFILTATLTSAAGGYFVRISILKLISFAVGTSAVFAGVLVLHLRKSDLSEWFVAVILAVVFLGFLALALGVAYNAKNPTGDQGTMLFNGPFYHPNTCGPFCALMAVYLACCFLLTNYRNRWLLVVLAGCLVYFLVQSQSRTGAGVLLIGLTTLGLLYLTRTGNRSLRIRKRMSRTALVATVVLGLGGIAGFDLLTGGRLAQQAISFVNKNKKTDAEITVTNVLASRRHLIEQSWEMFLKSPVIGHGFEVEKSEAFQRNAGLFSAPLEKGFLPTAVLEEVGIAGTIPFVIFILTLGFHLYRRPNLPGLAMWCTFLAVNFGEVMIFSPGGHGGFAWILLCAGILLGDQSLVQATTATQLQRPLDR